MLEATRKTVQFSEYVLIDGYLLPDGQFRAGMEGASLLVGYAKNWVSRLTSLRQKTLESLLNMGYTAYQLEVKVDSNNLRGSSLARTISIEDLNVLILYAAIEGKKKKAIALLRGFSKITLEDYFRHAFGIKPLSHSEKMLIVETMFDEIREELREQFLPGDIDAYGHDVCTDIFHLN